MPRCRRRQSRKPRNQKTHFNFFDPGARKLSLELLEERATPALVAAYAFNEGTGTTVGDASGSGNNGTTVSTTWSTAGKFGNALSFNGTSALVKSAAGKLTLIDSDTGAPIGANAGLVPIPSGKVATHPEDLKPWEDLARSYLPGAVNQDLDQTKETNI